ncbi:MAG: isocitrate dehydrogenase (NADP(+)) [Synergistota bacterium]|nr:isocitrate dehydrogenase (NADP(+)) [Synergistota bacterium]
MTNFTGLQLRNIDLPTCGSPITYTGEGQLKVPDDPVIPFIEGDGIGPDITRAMKMVADSAVYKAYGGRRKLCFWEIYAGEKCHNMFGEWLINDTLEAIKYFKVAIKGPLTTPVGGGIRSINVTLRQELELYACIRPVRYFDGVPSPLREPWKVNMVIFRENMEDVYAGIEWPIGSAECLKVRDFLMREMGTTLPEDIGLGVKPISVFGSKRLMRKALRYAIDRGRSSITIVHKGNIMKYTEGLFRTCCYELAKDEFPDLTITEEEVQRESKGALPKNKIVIKDRIADAMFQQILLRPEEYDVIAAPNLNGDYLSDAVAATVGGLGMAPGANVGDEAAVFEATHGTAPKYAGLDKVNPTSLILSSAMMLDHIGWKEAAELVVSAVEKTIQSRVVTYDLARQIEGATEVSCSKYAEALCQNM